MTIIRTITGSVVRDIPQRDATFLNPRVRDNDLTLLYQFDKYKDLNATHGLGPALSITRTTTATHFDASGIMQTAASGIARFDHSADGESLGLLIEEARTNICLQSEDLSTTWGNTNSTNSSNATTAPDGTATADELIEDSSASVAHYIAQAITATASIVHCYSTHLKSGTGSRHGIVRTDNDGPDSWIVVDLSDGSITETGSDVVNSGTISLPDSWYRCWFTFTRPTGTSAGFLVALSDSATPGSGIPAYNGDGASSIFVWGAQLEAGAFLTSYTKTTTSSVTRNKDDCDTTDVGWDNSNEGTLYVRGQFQSASAVARKILTLDDGGTTDRIFLELDASENINFATTHSADTDGASDGAAVIAVDTAFEVAAAFADDDVIAYVDGTLSGADTAAAFPLADAATTLRIGSDSAGNHFNGHIKELRYYNVRKNNQFLENLSNGLIPA